MRLIGLPAAFAVVAMRAGCHDVGPDMLATEMPRNDMVDCQPTVVSTTILASIIIPAKNFTTG